MMLQLPTRTLDLFSQNALHPPANQSYIKPRVFGRFVIDRNAIRPRPERAARVPIHYPRVWFLPSLVAFLLQLARQVQ